MTVLRKYKKARKQADKEVRDDNTMPIYWIKRLANIAITLRMVNNRIHRITIFDQSQA